MDNTSATRPAISGYSGTIRLAGETWIADLALAVAALDVDTDDTARTAAIASLLGLQPTHLPPSVPAPHAAAATPEAAPAASPPAVSPSPTSQRDTHQAPEPAARPALEQEPLQLLYPLTEAHAVPTKLHGTPLPAHPPQDSVTAPAPKPSLLPPRSELATLQTVLSRVVPEGRVDTDRLLELITTGQPLRSLPRHPVRTLRFGAQILVDLDAGMQLFAEDQEMLITKIRAITGSHATSVLYFADSPLYRTGPGAGWTWRYYRPPAPGTQVVILSNFASHIPGIQAPAALREQWRQLCQLLRRGNCQPTALVPLPPSRWPSWLTDLMPVLSWDRPTSTIPALP